jgi:hypothetical protein
MSALSDRVLLAAQQELAKGVRGGVKPFARFRGTRVDEYQRAVGLPVPPNPTVPAFPWCASAVYTLFSEAVTAMNIEASTQLVDGLGSGVLMNPCPRTGSALHLWQKATAYQTQQASPGSIFVMSRGAGKGHVGWVVSVDARGLLSSVEPDSSSAASPTGDGWASHVGWDPNARHNMTLVGFLNF